MSFQVPYPGPVPPYNNVPINSQYFKPSQFFISGITNGQTTTVTTTVDHNYVVGQLVRLIVPRFNAERELNEQSAYVISIPNPNQVELNIDSNSYNIFQTSTYPTQPQILAIGDVNSGLISNSGNVNVTTTIAGSYQNISPL
jgi:hypothetical protein